MERILKNSESAYAADLEKRAAEGQLRRCRMVEPISGDKVHVSVEGKPAINFSGNDYLGLASDERLKQAAIEAIRQYGTGSSASPLISGTGKLMEDLKAAVAAFKQAEAALVFNSGYQANMAILQAVLEPDDRVFCDKLNHASLIDGCMASRARWTRYRHLDLGHLAEKLAKAPRNARKWIVTDSVFSMDGDYPDLPALVELAEQYDALILVDEAHATGLYGDERSSGLCELYGVSTRIALQMGTFSKALGGSGAYVAGSKVMIDTLVNRARGFIYSTAMPPAVVAAALQAVQAVQADPSMKARLWENLAYFEQCLRGYGLDKRVILPFRSPIVPFIVGDSMETLALSEALLDRGYFVQGIRPPTVPPGTARLRITMTASHEKEDLDGLASTLAELMK